MRVDASSAETPAAVSHSRLFPFGR
jgi:hypothetical protein